MTIVAGQDILSADVNAGLGLNVKSIYGAKGDGATDDTAAIQAALNAVPAGGARVVLPAGNFIVTRTLTVATPGTTIVGFGQYATTITIPTHNFNLFNITAVGEVEMYDFGVTGQATGAAECYVINCNTAYDVRLRRMLFVGIFSGIFTGGSFFHCDNIQMINIKKTNGRGVVVNQTSGEITELDHVVIQNGPGNDARSGLYCSQVSSLQVTNCQFIKMGNAMQIAPVAGGGAALSIKCIGTWFDTSIGSGVVLDGTANEIDRVDFTSCWFGSCVYGLYIEGIVRGLRVLGSQLILNSQSGMVVTANSTVTGMIIANNEIAGNSVNGVDIGSNVSDFIISNNVVGPSSDFGGNSQNGIIVRGGNGDGFIISHNNLIGNGNALSVNAGVSIIVEKNLGVVGTIGQQKGSSQAIALNNATTTNICAISLGRGTWRVTGELWVNLSAPATGLQCGISNSSNSLQGDPTATGSRTTILAALQPTLQAVPVSAAIMVGPVTAYLNAFVTFSGSASAYGELQAQPAN